MTPQVLDFIPGLLEDPYKYIGVADCNGSLKRVPGGVVRIDILASEGVMFV